jgi:APA family basic amino acid/polyamine antiporter
MTSDVGQATGSPPAARGAEPVLERSIGLPGAVGFGLGAMIGTGVFVYTGVACGLAGPAVLLSLLIAGIAAACNGLSSAELASVYPRSGGTYDYAGRLLSPWAGYLAGWLFLAAKTTSAAATALAFGAYLGSLAGFPPLAVSLALVLGVTLLNFFRLTKAGAINIALVAVSVTSLGLFVATGLPDVSHERFSPFAPHGVGGILSASALLFVAYAGYGRIATLGEEVKSPRRTIPIALVLSLGAAAILYMLVTSVAVGRIGAEAFADAAKGGAPLGAAAKAPWVKEVLALGAATALGSVFLNLMLGLSRMTFAMARGKDLPSGLALVNQASSPFLAVLFVGVVVGGLVAIRSIVGLLSISAFTVLVYYGLTNASALRLGRAERLVHPVVPAAGLVFCLALAASVPPKHLGIGAAVLLAGVVWRLVWKAAAPSARVAGVMALAALLGSAGCRGSDPQSDESAPAKPARGPALPATGAGTIAGRAGLQRDDPSLPPWPVANAFVYIKAGLEGRSVPVPKEPVILDQVNFQFVPHVLGIRPGQALKITSHDTHQLHNVFCQPFNNKGFNQSMSAGEVVEKTFTTPEVMILVQCNIHHIMRAFVGVVDHPFFAVTGQDGTFEIKGLPPGRYKVTAWQEFYGSQTVDVMLGPEQGASIDFTYH